MKILVIIGSPQGKGSGYRVVTDIERQMKRMGDVDFEYLFLKDANLGLCRGCYRCAIAGEDQCPIKDDRALIEGKILGADGVILSSPIHMLNVSWPMKNFVDRFMYTNRRPRFFSQKALIVVNGITTLGPKKTLETMRMTLGGIRIVHEMCVATQPWPETQRIALRKERAIQDGAEKLYRACLDTRLPDPGFKEYLSFLILRSIYTEWKEHLPLDFEYYRGKEYFYEAKIGTATRLSAVAVAFVAVRLMRKTWA
jgi:multimeric flavodoxin WrbA